MHPRLVRIDGTYNLRDTGGYRTPTGTTKWGTLFRSDGLHKLTPDGGSELSELGIGRVIDLRDDLERKREPDMLPENIELISHPIFPSALAHVSERFTIFDLTKSIYLDHARSTVAALEIIAQTPTPTLVHCTAGKDRTGAVIALALTAVGVDRDDVFNDYAETEQHLRGEWLEAHLATLRSFEVEITDEVLGLISSSPVEAIETAMSEVEATYGSLEDYLMAQGADDAMLTRLHERLVS